MSDNNITLVTGAGSGIGAALCRRLASSGRVLFVHTGSKSENVESVCAEVGAQAELLTLGYFEQLAKNGVQVGPPAEDFDEQLAEIGRQMTREWLSIIGTVGQRIILPTRHQVPDD